MEINSIIAIFVISIVYLIIIFEKWNRTATTLLGASILLFLGISDFEEVFKNFIKWDTIFLLIGMMMLVSIVTETGFFDFISLKLLKKTKGDPIKILISTIFISIIWSAFLDNVTTAILLMPIIFNITTILKINPIIYIYTIIFMANLGGMLTSIGDPPNIIIASANKNLSFNDFLLNMSIPTIISSAFVMFFLWFRYKKTLITNKLEKIDFDKYEKPLLENKKDMYFGGFIISLTILIFFLYEIFHLNVASIALFFASIVIFWKARNHGDHKVDNLFSNVEWSIIFFIISLFIIVETLIKIGAISFIADQIAGLVASNMTILSSLVLWISGIFSGLLNNIPVTTMMIPIIENIANIQNIDIYDEKFNYLWWSLALGAGAGANLTIIASNSTTFIINYVKKRNIDISIKEFFKVGFIVTFISLIIFQVYILLIFF